MQSIKFISTDHSGIDRIKTLWEGLNKHHQIRSENFRERYSAMTFEKRKQMLFKKLGDGEMFVELAIDMNNDKKVGYCLSIAMSLPENEGEVESLYIDPAYRGKGIGEVFMKHAIEWLDSKKIVCKRIVVAAGNEEVFPFYERFGFYPKFIILEQN
jgi:ribosomal protein S18 acetylase RimI-like enzyme